MAETTGKINGDDVLIYCDGVAVGHSTDATLSISQDTPDSTTKDSSKWTEHIRGNRGWEISGSGLVVPAHAMNAAEVIDFILNSSNVTIRWSNSNAGDIEYRGAVSVTASSLSAAQNSPYSFDFSFMGNGPLSKITIT